MSLVDPSLETAWFQPLSRLSSGKPVSNFAFKRYLCLSTEVGDELTLAEVGLYKSNAVDP